MRIKSAIKAIAKKVFTKENISTGMRFLVETIIANKKKDQRKRIRRK